MSRFGGASVVLAELRATVNVQIRVVLAELRGAVGEPSRFGGASTNLRALPPSRKLNPKT